MKFSIDKETFLKSLQKVQGIVEKRNTMPILSNVLIEAIGDTILITATDLEVGIRSSYPAKVDSEGKITVSAKKLYEIIKELPDQEIFFSVKDNDWVAIVCGKAQFSIVGLSSDEFPPFPKVSEESLISMKGSILKGMIEKTSYAICHDETKYNLNGIYIKLAEEGGSPLLRMVATDGHRLAIAEKEVEGTVSRELTGGVIMPKKGVFELRKISEEEDGDILIGFMDNSAVIKKGNTLVVMRLVDGEFPDYTRVIPANNDKVLAVGREALLHSLKRMSILSSEKFKGIKFELDENSLELSTSNPELGEAREEIEVSYPGSQLMVRFNARYLMDVLQVLDDEQVEIVLRDELSPAIVKPTGTGSLAVIMPMRL
jgi:DNA polymerase-3 subunit beta